MSKSKNSWMWKLEKAMTLMAIIVLTPIVIPALFIWAMVVKFIDWVKYEWQLMDMSEEQILSMQRRLRMTQGVPGQMPVGVGRIYGDENKNRKGNDNENEK